MAKLLLDVPRVVPEILTWQPRLDDLVRIRCPVSRDEAYMHGVALFSRKTFHL